MSLPEESDPALTLELIQLVGTAVDDDLSPAESARLQQLLRESPEARRYYLKICSLESMLMWEHGSPQLLSDSPGARRPLVSRPVVRTALVAAAAALVAALITFIAVKPPLADQAPPPVVEVLPSQLDNDDEGRMHARVIGLYGAHWDTALGSDELTLGGWVPKGQVRLRSGEITLTFDSGAIVRAQGPVSLDIDGPNRGYLHYGKVVAFVPPQASGFMLNTPSASLIDLGTRFATSVTLDGETDVHVIEGEVEVVGLAQGVGSEPHRLNAGESARLGLSYSPIAFDVSEFGDAVGSFDVDLAPFPELMDYVHWSFDAPVDNVATGRTATGATYSMSVESDEPSAPGGENRWEKGRFGESISFDGVGDWALSDYPGVGGNDPRTVAFWIKTPPKFTVDDVPAILTWGGGAGGNKWEIVPNPYASQGPVGALRVSCSPGNITGSTDIQNGRWNHVALVFLGGEGATLRDHVRIYINGKFDPPGGLVSAPVNTDITSDDAYPLTLGKYIDENNAISGYLPGLLDELYIFAGALTPQQIARLYLENRVE